MLPRRRRVAATRLYTALPVNVFILNAGRSGSKTFARACSHATNYTSAHESRSGLLGEAHFDYPDNHIESDNRLSWLLGRLDRRFGDRAFYVHLVRDVAPVAASWAKRSHTGMMNAYRHAILWHCPKDATPLEVALDYCDTVAENIRLFLRDKTNCMELRLEEAHGRFPEFWRRIGAEGDLDAALAEFGVRHNAAWQRQPASGPGPLAAAGSKLYRIVRKLPVFLRNA
jgi:hypothetical protein